MEKPDLPNPNHQSNILVVLVAFFSVWILFSSSASFFDKSAEKRLAKQQLEGQVVTPNRS